MEHRWPPRRAGGPPTVPQAQPSDIYSRFVNAAKRFDTRTAIEVQRRDGVERHDYRDLRRMSEAWARRLRAGGLVAGDRCAILGDNDANWCAAFLGIQRVGAVAVPLDTSYRPEQVAALVADSGATVLCAAPRLRTVGEQARRELAGELFVAPLTRAAGEQEHGRDELGTLPGRDDRALILYTSGTTADPKGVVLTHGNLLAEIDAVLGVIALTENDAVLAVLPLYHALALVANLLLPLTVGARVVYLEAPSSPELARAFAERDVSGFCCVPQFFYLVHRSLLAEISRAGRWKRLAFRTLSLAAGAARERAGINLGRRLFRRMHRALGARMRWLVVGGSRFDERVGRDLYRLGFDILQAYGLTETSGAVTLLRPGDRHVASAGQPLRGVEIRIAPSGTEKPQPHGAAVAGPAQGEILVRGPVVSRGYHHRPELDAVTYRDGWLHTGDLGRLDREGRLYVTGRIKELIVLGSGKNIDPEELETHYQRSRYIREICVLGLVRPNEPAEERLHAVVRPDFDVLRESRIVNAREILRWELEGLSAQLPPHKRILGYDVVSEALPRTTTGKLKRREVERRVLSASPAPAMGVGREPDTASAADPQAMRVLAIVRGSTRAPGSVRPEANLELDLGLDSLARVELLTRLEAELGIVVDEESAQRIYTVAELIDAARAASDATPRTAPLGDAWRRVLARASSADPAVAGLLEQRAWLSAVGFVALAVLRGLAAALLGFRVTGREHLPRTGAFLVCPNHQSFLDAFFVTSALPWSVLRRTFFVGASVYFEGPRVSRLARLLRIVPVDPDANLVRAMRAGAWGLRHGLVLLLFPEGERSIDGEIKQFKAGAAILSLQLGLPIVPVALDGAFDIWPRGRSPRWTRLFGLRNRVRVRIGPPLAPPTGAAFGDSDYAALTGRLRSATAGLLAEIRERG